MYKLLLFIFLILFQTGCSTKTAYTNRTQIMMMSESQEVSIGDKNAQQIKKQEAKFLDKNYYDLKKVQQIGYKIAKVSNKKNFKWEFHTIDKKLLNAFCLPGGKVFVYKGIIDLTSNIHELATVMSHEVAHALLRHGAERASIGNLQNIGAQLLNFALAVKAPQYRSLANDVYGIGTRLGLMLPYSRKHELEADLVGLQLMKKAGYNPKYALSFWKKMGAKSKGSKNDFLSTHPSDIKRIEQIKKFLKIN